MSWVDIAVLAIISVSCAISIMRGFVKESVSLAAWVLAFILSMTLSDSLALLLEGTIEQPAVRTAAAYAILFMSTLLVGGLAKFMLGTMVEKTGLTSTDRTLGAFFGIVRGVIIICVAVIIAGMTKLPQAAWWNDSFMLDYFVPIVKWMAQFIPEEIAQYIVFN